MSRLGFFNTLTASCQIRSSSSDLFSKDDGGQLQTYSSKCSCLLPTTACSSLCSRIVTTSPAEDRQDQTGSFSTVCLPGAAAIDKGRSPWHQDILKLSWTTLIYNYSLSLSEKCKVGSNPRRFFNPRIGKDPLAGIQMF